MIFIVLFCEMIWAHAYIFIVCESGQKVSDAFRDIGYEFDQFKWYLLSIKMRKMFPIFMIVTQKPVGLDVFGNISADREDFKKVSRKLKKK